MSAYAYVWEFRTTAATRAAFVGAYREGGDWDLLFRRDPSFLGTILLQSQDDPDVFMTIDRWENEAAFRSFMQRSGAEYAALDSRCSGLTVSEQEIGTYDELRWVFDR